jgi:hypothetical protein
VTQSYRPRPLNIATLMICFVFLAIRISGVHTHHAPVPHADDLTATHATLLQVELGLFHVNAAQVRDHNQDVCTKPVEHVDLKLDDCLHVPVKLAKLTQVQIALVAQVMLRQFAPLPAPSAMPRYNQARAGPQRPRLRPPSCGPPNSFIV